MLTIILSKVFAVLKFVFTHSKICFPNLNLKPMSSLVCLNIEFCYLLDRLRSSIASDRYAVRHLEALAAVESIND